MATATAISLATAVTRAAAWTAGFVEGLVAGICGHYAARGVRSRARLAAAQVGPFVELRRAIMGRSRRQIQRVLGVPPTASIGFGVHVAGPKSARDTHWQATTWYYPFDQGERRAIAIRFVGDRAREVEFIGIEDQA